MLEYLPVSIASEWDPVRKRVTSSLSNSIVACGLGTWHCRFGLIQGRCQACCRCRSYVLFLPSLGMSSWLLFRCFLHMPLDLHRTSQVFGNASSKMSWLLVPYYIPLRGQSGDSPQHRLSFVTRISVVGFLSVLPAASFHFQYEQSHY